MFELPEYVNLARQLRATVTGKRVAAATLGNSPHKFVWYNKYICDMRPTPTDPDFSLGYFNSLVDECVRGERRSVKSLLTQDQLIPGLGSAIAQDILFKAKLHPRHAVDRLDPVQRKALYRAILGKVSEVTDAGGRNDELDLFGEPGGYPRIMDKSAVGGKCPDCGATIEKIQYLGGACYFCPSCQI